MKEMPFEDLKEYLEVGHLAYDGSYEFKWLREYKRCKYIPFFNTLSQIFYSYPMKYFF